VTFRVKVGKIAKEIYPSYFSQKKNLLLTLLANIVHHFIIFISLHKRNEKSTKFLQQRYFCCAERCYKLFLLQIILPQVIFVHGKTH